MGPVVKGVWILKVCVFFGHGQHGIKFSMLFPRAEQKVRELNEEQARKASEAETKKEEKEKAEEAGQ